MIHKIGRKRKYTLRHKTHGTGIIKQKLGGGFVTFVRDLDGRKVKVRREDLHLTEFSIMMLKNFRYLIHKKIREINEFQLGDTVGFWTESTGTIIAVLGGGWFRVKSHNYEFVEAQVTYKDIYKC